MKTAIGILMVLLVGTSFAEVLSGSAYPQDAYTLYASLYDDYECNSAVKIFYDSFYDAHSILVCYPGNTVGYSSMESLFNYEPTSEPALLIIVTVRAVADFTAGTNWTSEYLLIMFDDYIVKISTYDARRAICAWDAGDEETYALILAYRTGFIRNTY